MMTQEQIKHIADLAHIELTPEEETRYGGQLSAILDYIDKLAAVDTTGVSITAQVNGLVNVWREDEVKPWHQDEVAAALAQGDTESDQVKVKRVL
jgi:aspartyl-tRNA(Asn)/glutamyl-tRNA(Gln) amidotransferase subunit C